MPPYHFNTLMQQFADAVRTGSPDARDLAGQFLDLEGENLPDRPVRARIALDILLKNATEGSVALDAELVRLFLDAGANPNARYDSDTHPLVLAIQAKSVEAAKLLLEAGADARALKLTYNYSSGRHDGKSVLVIAIENGLTEIARLLLERGADAIGDENSPKPLSVAARTGNIEIAELLLSRGAQIGTELTEAAQTEDNPMVAWLLKQGADPNACDSYNNSPASFAAQNNALNNVRLLVEAGAKFNQSMSGGSGLSPLHSAVINESSRDNEALVTLLAEHTDAPDVLLFSLERAVSQAHLTNTRILVEACQRVGIDMNGDYSYLFAALAKGVSNFTHERADEAQRNTRATNSVEVAQFLWDSGLRLIPSQVDKALRYAIGRNNNALTFWLLELDAPEPEGHSLLHTAAAFGRLEITRALLEKGANVNAVKESDGYTPLMSLVHQGQTSALLKAGGSLEGSILLARVEENDAVVAQLLIDAGADVNARSATGKPVLLLAAYDASPRIVEMLLKAGADVESPVSSGGTVLSLLVRNNRRQDRWQKDEKREKQFSSPFRVSMIYERQPIDELLTRWDETIVQLLLDAGANVNTRNNQGWTPLHRAMIYATPRMVEMLLEAGADPNAPRPDGQSIMRSFWRNTRTNKILFAIGFLISQFPDVRASIESHANGEPLPAYLEHSQPVLKQSILEDSAKYQLLLRYGAAP